jgi:hypothetical protein
MTDPRYTWEGFFALAMPALRSDPSSAIAAIRAAAGDDPLAQVGGYSLIAELDPTVTDAGYVAMMDTTLRVMFDQGFSSGHMNRYEADRWIELHGDLRTSFDRIVEIPVPPPDHSAGLELAPGETLMLAIIGPELFANQLWIERAANGTYQAFSMREYETGDGTLTRCEEPSIEAGDTPEVVLRSTGAYLGSAPFWAHDALVPYFTERRAL